MNRRILISTHRFIPLLILLTGLAQSVGLPGNGRAAAAPAPAPTAAAPAASAAPSEPQTPTYNGTQQSQYIAAANTAFIAERDAKFHAFLDARTAFETAGGIDPKGLTAKTIAERRQLLTAVRAAHDDYLTFTTTQDDTYRAELAKTPLVPADVDSVVTEFEKKANTPRSLKLQQSEKDLLACSDEMLADLDQWDGKWTVTGAGKLSFKKKANQAAYMVLQKKYNGLVADMQQTQAEASPTVSPSPGPSPLPGASPSPAVAAPAPASVTP